MYFIGKESEVRHPSKKGSMSIKFGKYCTPGCPGWTPKTNICISENSFPEVSQAYLNLTPFFGLQTINILASYADHSSLKILQ